MPASAALLLILAGQTWGSGDAVTAAGAAGAGDDNVIRLSDQNLPVIGVSVAEQVAEFEAGIKIGPATYDNREHAFFQVLNDFSAGLGYRFIDVRDELGGFWTQEKENALDVSREKYICLPPKQTTVQDTAPTYSPTNNFEWASHNTHVASALFTRRLYIVHGSAIYLSYDGGLTFTKDYEAAGGQFTTIEETFSEPSGFPVMVAGGYARRYVQTDTGSMTVWSNGTLQREPLSLMWWDEKLLELSVFGCAFAVWATDPDTFESDLEWNVANPLDGEYIFKFLNDGVLRWVGTGSAPWGQPAPYFHDSKRLYVLDFFARKYYPIELGIGRPITGTALWNGAMELNDGFNVWEYNPGGQTVRNIGLRDKEGLAPSLRAGSGGEYRLRKLIPADKDMYAIANTVADLTGAPRSILMQYNGKGWQQVGKPVNYWATGGVHVFNNYQSEKRSIVIWGTDNPTSTSANMYHTYYELPIYSDTPIPGRENFGDSGASFITGWMNGGFSDLDGTLLRMRIDALYLTDTETVKVEYQLDNDEDMDWVQLVDGNKASQLFDEDHDTLYFWDPGEPDNDPRQGIEFNSVRFRVTCYRDTDETLSPVIRALTLMYIKVPDFRLALTFQIDVNRMLEERVDTTYFVDGVAPTLRSVHQKLISLWNEHLLHHLTVPNVVIEEDNCYVRIVGMPLRFEDFRDSVAGRGTIELSVLEPLERVP